MTGNVRGEEMCLRDPPSLSSGATGSEAVTTRVSPARTGMAAHSPRPMALRLPCVGQDLILGAVYAGSDLIGARLGPLIGREMT